MFDNRLALMAGIDIPIPELQLTLHQPKIKEIALIGDSNFFLAIQCLQVNKNILSEDKIPLDEIKNFHIFMAIMSDEETLDKKEAVLQLLTLLFPQYKVSILPRSVLFMKDGEAITIDENNFDILQDSLKDIFCLNKDSISGQSFNPNSKKAKEIADKLMRARQRVAAQHKEGEGSVFVEYASVLTVGLNSMSLEDCLNLTMFQMFDLIERYTLWLDWDLDIKSRLAGEKPDSKPDNWMKNIH